MAGMIPKINPLYDAGFTDGREAQRAEVERLRAALEPFEDVDGEGAEDFPDETPVVVTFGRSTRHGLSLGDFRRARAASSDSETGGGSG